MEPEGSDSQGWGLGMGSGGEWKSSWWNPGQKRWEYGGRAGYESFVVKSSRIGEEKIDRFV